MRIVTEPIIAPQTCAAMPHRHFSDRFIDTETDLPGIDPHIYVSETAVGEMARLFEYLPKEGAEAQAEAIEGLEAKVEELETECNRLQAQFDAIDLLGSAGYTARKKQGRPPKPLEG